MPEFSVVGASPELLVRVEGDEFVLRPENLGCEFRESTPEFCYAQVPRRGFHLAASCPTMGCGCFRHQAGRFLQNIKNRTGTEHPVALAVANLGQDAAGLQ